MDVQQLIQHLPQNVDLTSAAAASFAAFLAVHLGPYAWDRYHLKSIPGPFWAKFSDAWLAWVAANGHRSEEVHKLHEKLGPVVRIAPNHISIADPDALQIIYAHGSNTLKKSNFYDAFVSIRRAIFNTREKADHARKRKIVANTFSQKNVIEFEPRVRIYVGQIIDQWDRLSKLAAADGSGDEGESGWYGKDERLWLDVLPWMNYLAFDIIGDLAFGQPFGMILKAKDSAPVAVSQDAAMDSYGKECKVIEVPAVKILNDRGDYNATLGTMPPWVRPYVRKLPWFSQGSEAAASVAGMAVAAVSRRLTTPTDRVDILSKLQQGKDENGEIMGPEELTAEALTHLVAGSDTTANSSCAIIYYLAAYPHVQEKLQKELDEALGSEDEPVTTYEQVKRLTYLEVVILEVLRLHSTIGLGLPRMAPEGGLTVHGTYFPEGTILSVPTYTLHRDKRVWGDDPEIFRPERWFEENSAKMHKAFNTFSFGPRACVGRNLANLELLIIVSSLLRRYDFVLKNPGDALGTCEGFLRKPTDCWVGLRRRAL
ncbi:cytochrome P450 monooxygenase pc-bph [Coniophora puteana RWD-64-598 SS2]|uniref:Cytochrome P450 monooxygenase pc-bph n=1 Tax=Coniophora puteana (strain RWD-64-598) TaxID=741705 RepID=A0A5M3MIG1_CONPW|nr:cytochrome P450 monooxygenase pc-bph [Coniophora puteana RWD-64-598 SS2]EIW78435.1 cytochrome P450 monooxygenase pc-bph [Coniophora puteana RWD-64-598 SS2]